MQLQRWDEMIAEFSCRIENPLIVKQLDLERTKGKDTTSQVVWNDLSLCAGYPGILILCTVLEKKKKLPEGVSHRYVIEIKKALENSGTQDLSLFGGFAGLCFALEEASLGGTRYGPFIRTLQNHLLSRVQEHLLNPLMENVKNKEASSPFLYDPISGVCGIGRYALEHLNSSPFYDLSEQITKIVIQLTHPIMIHNHLVPGWYVPPTNRINRDRFAKQHPKGNFNLGLAHGVTGILSYLSIAYLKGLRTEGLLDAIERVSGWIKNKSFSIQGKICWPFALSFEEEISGRQIDHKMIKAGWCYGVPGIARTLYLAGKALNQSELKDFAMQVIVQLLSQSPTSWRLPGPCLCHGIAGLLAITHAMSKEKEGQGLRTKSLELQHLLMDQFHADATWGFVDVEEKMDGLGNIGLERHDKINFLEGATGVVLSLLSITDQTVDQASRWSLPLMMYE